MYRPACFEETGVEVLHALMRGHPLEHLMHTGPDGLGASPRPFEIA